MMIRMILTAAVITAAVLTAGCSLDPMSPAVVAGNYYVQSTDNADPDYYVILITSETAGEIYEYDKNGTPDNLTDDTIIGASTETMTITVGFPWYFSSSTLLDHDGINVGRASIRIPNFDGQSLAFLPASGEAWPPS